MSKTPKRNIRIDDETWGDLKKAAKPESVSILLRRIIREFLLNRQNNYYVRTSKNPLANHNQRVVAAVQKAIKRGILIVEPCEVCGCIAKSKEESYARTIFAHHDNYNKPLDVRWLCIPCHVKWHENNKAVQLNSENIKKTSVELFDLGCRQKAYRDRKLTDV